MCDIAHVLIRDGWFYLPEQGVAEAMNKQRKEKEMQEKR